MLFLVAGVLVLPGCTTDDGGVVPAPPVDHGSILPLAVGNSWYYRESLFDTAGVPIGETRDTMTLVRDTLIGGLRWFADRGGVFYGVTDGIAVRNMFPSDTGAYLFLLYPVREGYVEYDGPGGYRVASLGRATLATVTVPAGTFECLAYIFRDPPRETLAYYVTPGVGIIRVVVSGRIRELEGFRVDGSVPPRR
jgi:hypothetical protein